MNSILKRPVFPWTESKYETTLRLFDRYYELHPGFMFPPNYQSFKCFLVWVLTLTKGRIKSSPGRHNPDGTPRLLPYISTLGYPGPDTDRS
jgi:hypothetical protein